jgi:hypothetical protein
MMNRRPISRTAILGLLMAGAMPGQAQAEAAPTLLFDDVTDTHVPVSKYLHALDVALVDVDGDDDRDAVLAVEMGPNRLYINDGQGHLEAGRSRHQGA